MSILSSMYSAVAGLGAHGEAVDVVSDNIANVNTIGFKAGRGRFEDVLGSTITHDGHAGAGQGSRLAGVDQTFVQGSLLGTGVATDLALQGDGFFILHGPREGVDGMFYSRAGNFHLDTSGILRSPSGLAVQGYLANGAGELGTSLRDLVVPPGANIPPQATTRVDVGANLDAASAAVPPFDPTDPSGTSSFSSSITVYDSLGSAHAVDVFFRQSAPGAWEWHALVDGGELTGGTAGTPMEGASGTLTFDTTGALVSQTTAASSFDFVGATPGQTIAFGFGDPTSAGGTGREGVTSYAAPSATTSLGQDGYTAGALAGIRVGDDGRVTGSFTNGEQRLLGQVAVARFRNNQGLLRAGAGLFVSSEDSGEALVGAAGTGGRGSIASGSLEQSNVDLAQEFVNLIAYQRGFQASSKAVTTADEMLQDLVNLKR